MNSIFTSPALRAMVTALTLSFTIPSATAQVAPPPVPAVHKHIYPEITAAKADVHSGLRQAAREHKRVLLIFGGDWCGDCQVLDINLHDPANVDLLAKSFVVVHVNVGHKDQNIDLAAKYGVPIDKGVPAVSVIDARGRIIHAQTTGDFSDMRHMDPRSVNQFLTQWQS